ncbi:heme uptake protein IsdC [Mammaliicoccus sciuri]|uniref:heme uptake protein IsdC n=1 Tax=Mammaliicoccus sciuri TaxID=1296 RepID=UPI001AEC03D5|nr:heme uptake protein IsdC [Mammaliicoccus sciuri]MEB6256144.1 heme uptake protein IsdC [Mammaliicoccus sciuri]
MQRLKQFLNIGLLVLILLSVGVGKVASADVKDGTYDVDYTVLKHGTSDVSIANDYFNKPGKLVVKNGEKQLQLTMNHSHWIKGITVDGSAESIVSEDKGSDVRTSSFKVNSTSGQLAGTIDVYINEKVDGKPFLYDNKYKITFDVKEPSGQAAAVSSSDASKNSTTAASSSTNSSTPSNGSTTTSQDVKNPQTSAGTPVMITVLPIVAGMLLIVTFMFNKKLKRGHN